MNCQVISMRKFNFVLAVSYYCISSTDMVRSKLKVNGTSGSKRVASIDLTRKICATDQLSSKVNAKSIMSSLTTVDKNATILDGVQIVTRNKHLAIKSDADKIVGIISATDLAKYFKNSRNISIEIELSEETKHSRSTLNSTAAAL